MGLTTGRRCCRCLILHLRANTGWSQSVSQSHYCCPAQPLAAMRRELPTQPSTRPAQDASDTPADSSTRCMRFRKQTRGFFYKKIFTKYLKRNVNQSIAVAPLFCFSLRDYDHLISRSVAAASLFCVSLREHYRFISAIIFQGYCNLSNSRSNISIKECHQLGHA